ncbi:hypothetical protein ES703_62495 [subsurface metagenome]
MTETSVSIKSKAQQQNKVKQGGCQVAGRSLLYLSPGGSSSLTPGLKLGWIIGHGQLYYTSRDASKSKSNPLYKGMNTRLLVPLANLVPVAFLLQLNSPCYDRWC